MCFLIALQINGLSAQVTSEKQANQQYSYKIVVEGIVSPSEAKPVIVDLLAIPNITACDFIESIFCFKLNSASELDMAVIVETLSHYDLFIKTNTGLPAGFPEYNNTGNPEQDNENYEKAKKQWIINNPDKYLNLINQAKTNDASK